MCHDTYRLTSTPDISSPDQSQDSDILMTPDLQSSARSQTTLLVPDLTSGEDAGVYRCKGRNVWGEVNATFPVVVHGKLSQTKKLS